MDAAASVAGLVTLADVILRRLYKYGSGVRDAPEEIKKLIAETSIFYGFLQSLKLVAEEISNEQSLQVVHLPFIQTCQKALEKVKTELDKHQSPVGRWKWPLSSEKTKRLLEDIERQKSTLSLALTANSTKAIFDKLGGVEKAVAGLEHKLEVNTRIMLDKERQEILNSFSQVDPRVFYETNIRLRHLGTCTWFIEGDEFKAWATESNSGLWIYGIPGAGKSILAASVIEYAIVGCAMETSENAAVYFFCDYKTPETQVPANVIASLVRQLAQQEEACFDVVEKYYRKRTSRGSQWSLPTSEVLADLFVEMSYCFSNCMVIVDGIDECGKDQAEVVELLSGLRERSDTIKMIVLSRNEREIGDYMSNFENVSIAAASSDIRLYVAAEIERRINAKKLRLRNSALKEEIMDKLIDGAQGMFRWVACQMDYLCELPTDSMRRKALQTLPPTLFETYERILERLNEKDTFSQRIVQRTLRWVIFGWTLLGWADSWRRTSIIEALCEAVSIEDDAVQLHPDSIPDKEEILRLCSCLLRESSDRTRFELAHFTVVVRKPSLISNPITVLVSLSMDLVCSIQNPLMYINQLQS